MKSTYILFKIEELYFLIPLRAVIAVEPGRKTGKAEKEAWDLGYLCGIRKQKKETDYILALRAGAEEFRIYADLVVGVKNVEEKMTRGLEAPIVWEKNEYLERAAFLEELVPPIAYILDVFKLHEKIRLQEKPAADGMDNIGGIEINGK